MARTSIDALNLNKAEGDSNIASRHSGAMAPQATFYKPSYRMLNHITWSSDVSGQVNFGQAIGNTGQKLFDNMASLKENEVLSSKYDEIHKSLQEKSQAWKAQSETGEGYLEYISAEHAKLAENALSGILDPVFAGRMRNMLMRSKADWENGAFEEEQAMRTAYSLRTAQQTITNLNFDVSNNPATYESGLEALKNALAGYREVAGVQAFNKVYDDALKNYTYSYGLGLVQKDPANFERLAKDGRLSVISPERIMHLQHMATDELKRRAFESQKAEKLVELASLRDQNISGIEAIKQMKKDGALSISDTAIESMQLSDGIKQNVMQSRGNIRREDEKELRKVNEIIRSVESGNGVADFQPQDQLAFLNMMLPTDENGIPSQSFSDKIDMASYLGITATDKSLKHRIDGIITNSPNAEEILRATEARNKAAWADDILIGKPSPKVKYVMGRVKYGSGNDPSLAVAVRDKAVDYWEKIQADPAKLDELAARANSYIESDKYEELQKEAWDEVEEELGVPNWWQAFLNAAMPVNSGLVSPAALSESSKYQLEITKDEFSQFFRTEMKELLASGWRPDEAADEVTENFLKTYGATTLVPYKMMYKPPERVYPNMTPQTLKAKYHKEIASIFEEYKKNDYKPCGYELSLNDKGLVEYKNGDERGKAFPNLEWNPKTKCYNPYIIKEDGVKLYFTALGSAWELIDIDFNEIKLERQNASK